MDNTAYVYVDNVISEGEEVALVLKALFLPDSVIDYLPNDTWWGFSVAYLSSFLYIFQIDATDVTPYNPVLPYNMPEDVYLYRYPQLLYQVPLPMYLHSWDCGNLVALASLTAQGNYPIVCSWTYKSYPAVNDFLYDYMRETIILPGNPPSGKVGYVSGLPDVSYGPTVYRRVTDSVARGSIVDYALRLHGEGGGMSWANEWYYAMVDGVLSIRSDAILPLELNYHGQNIWNLAQELQAMFTSAYWQQGQTDYYQIWANKGPFRRTNTSIGDGTVTPLPLIPRRDRDMESSGLTEMLGTPVNTPILYRLTIDNMTLFIDDKEVAIS